MKYLTRFLVFVFLISLTFVSCENLMFIDAAQLYVVSFESNGGTEIEAYRTDRIEKGPACVKEDAEFLGWYTSSDFSSNKITFPYELKEDTTLYANWIQKYQVYFETNGGSEIAGYKASEIKDSPITLKNGNVFMGWYTTREFSGEPVTFPYTLTEPTVFYAKWDQLFTVQFETNGGTALADFRGSIIAEAPVSSKTGYVLKGWYADKDFSQPVSFPYVLSSDCTLYAKWEASSDITYTVEHYKKDFEAMSYILSDSETLTGSTASLTNAKAKSYTGFHNQSFEQKKISADGSTVIDIYYDLDSFTIIFNSNDGTNDTYNQTYFYNYSQKLLTNRFTRSNYTFEGWATEKNGKVQYADCASVKFTLKNDSTKNLYAVWSYGSTITDSTVESLKLSSLKDEYTVRIKGSISQNTIDKLIDKISVANKPITLDLSATTGLDTISGTFYTCKNLVKVILPEGLTTIASQTFNGCSSLKTIVLPKSLRTIGSNAFYNSGLEEISLNGVSTIGSYAFGNCKALCKVSMSGVSIIDQHAFDSCIKLPAIIIDAKNIGWESFGNCTKLTSVTISKTVKKIDGYAFNYFENLSAVSFLDTANWYGGSSKIDVTNTATNATHFKYKTWYEWTKR